VEANRVELAQALERVEWQGKTIPLKNEKVQLALVRAQTPFSHENVSTLNYA
jgi:hypothetical protein